MVAFSAALDAALSPPYPRRLLGFFDASFPDETRYYGSAAVGSVAGYQRRVLNWGEVVEQASDARSGEIVNTTLELAIADEDDTIRSLTESVYADELIGSAGLLRVGAEGVAEADWAEMFRGVLSKIRLDPGVATLTYVQDEAPLGAIVPASGWIIGRQFPAAHKSARGQVAPIVYGEHDSAPYTNQGFIPALLVDTTGNKRHLVCALRAKAVPAVFNNGVQQLVTTDYTIEYQEITGRIYTLIVWTAAGKPSDTDTITCDVDGLEDVGDGSGDVITEPAEQLEHFLINFVFSDNRKGNWAASHASVDSTALAALAPFFDARRYSVGIRIWEQQPASDLIAKWGVSQTARVWWQEGKVRAGVLDHTRTDADTVPWLPAYTRIRRPPVYLHDDWLRRSSGLAVKAVVDASQDEFVRHFSVGQQGRAVKTEESLEIAWGATS